MTPRWRRNNRRWNRLDHRRNLVLLIVHTNNHKHLGDRRWRPLQEIKELLAIGALFTVKENVLIHLD